MNGGRFLHGIDVSAVQGRINWPLVALHGIRFCWSKCGQGNDGYDPNYTINVKGCRDTGIYPGAYWFAYNLPQKAAGDGRTPKEEAERFFRLSGGLGRAPGELPPAIDAEWPEVGDWGKWGCSAKQISDWHREFAIEVTQLWGRLPTIYTYPFWWRTLSAGADVSWAAQYPLWIANYMQIDREEPTPEATPIIPSPWSSWRTWQWSANKGRRIPGIAMDIDRNVFNGTPDELRRFVGINPDADTLPEGVNVATFPTLYAPKVMPEHQDIVYDLDKLGSDPPPPDDDAA